MTEEEEVKQQEDKEESNIWRTIGISSFVGFLAGCAVGLGIGNIMCI